MFPATLNVIPVRDERQAMDWSLVLASQGIAATIERHADTLRWQLLVDAPDYTRAIRSLRAYVVENKTRRWQHALPGTGLLFDARSAVWLMLLALVFAAQTGSFDGLVKAGVMDNHLVQSGQWWRMFTAISLHADVAHLTANLLTGIILIGLAMGAYGGAMGILLPFFAGVAGNLAGFVVYPESHQGLGASGMVLGALGLLTAQSFALLRHGITSGQLAIRGVLSGFLLLILLGLSPERHVDVLAHVAGFGAGAAFGAMLALLPREAVHRPWVQMIAGTLGAAAFVGSWWFALHAH